MNLFVRSGKALRIAALPVHTRAGRAGRRTQPVGDSGQDLVPEPAHEAQEADAEAAAAKR